MLVLVPANPKIREEFKKLNIQQAKLRLKSINNSAEKLKDFIRREIALRPMKAERKRIVEALLEEQKKFQEMEALYQQLLLELRDSEEQGRLIEQQRLEHREQIILEEQVAKLMPDFEELIDELEAEGQIPYNEREEFEQELFEREIEGQLEGQRPGLNPQEQETRERIRGRVEKIFHIRQYLFEKFNQLSPTSLKTILLNNPYHNYSEQELKGIVNPQYKNELIGLLVKQIIQQQETNIINDRYNPEQDVGIQARINKQGVSSFGYGVNKKFHAKKIKIGRGLTVTEEKPRYREFGKNRIHNKLLDENVIHIKYPSLANIPSLKPVEVSSNYRDLIIGLLDTGRVDNKKLSNLSSKEDEHFRKIIKASGLSEQLEIHPKRDDQEEKDYNRLVLLKGEYEAGNNNEKMIKELRGLIVKFISLGRIPRKTGLNFLMQISI